MSMPLPRVFQSFEDDLKRQDFREILVDHWCVQIWANGKCMVWWAGVLDVADRDIQEYTRMSTPLSRGYSSKWQNYVEIEKMCTDTVKLVLDGEPKGMVFSLSNLSNFLFLTRCLPPEKSYWQVPS